MKYIGGILGGVFALALFSSLFGSWYSVDEGERAVLLRNGAIKSIQGPGLHWKIPFIDDVAYISVQEHAQVYDAVETYSYDQQVAHLRISVIYKVPESEIRTVYATFGTREAMVERLVDRKLTQSVKEVFGQFSAARSIQERVTLNKNVNEKVIAAITGPVTVLSVQIEDIAFSEGYEKSIEDRMLAEVEVQKIHQQLEQEKINAEILVTKAQAEADSTVAKAKANAESVVLNGEAEARSIAARGSALRDNPSLISLIQAERWNGLLPTTMLPGGTVPFINVAPQ